MSTKSLPDALNSVRQSLLAAAASDAADTVSQSESLARRQLDEAQEEASRIGAAARARGEADAEAALAADRAAAHRAGRGLVLRARNDAYEMLRNAVHDAVAALDDEPERTRLREVLTAAARRALQPGARLMDAPGGGLIGEEAGRRVDLSLDGFAERAVQALVARTELT